MVCNAAAIVFRLRGPIHLPSPSPSPLGPAAARSLVINYQIANKMSEYLTDGVDRGQGTGGRGLRAAALMKKILSCFVLQPSSALARQLGRAAEQ